MGAKGGRGVERVFVHPENGLKRISGRGGEEAFLMFVRNRSCLKDSRICSLAIFCFLWFMCLSNFSWGVAQEASKIEGLDRGARDSMRLDERMQGREEKGGSDRVTDQMMRGTEEELRTEMREEEMIRSEEEVRSNRARMQAQQEEQEKRRKHEDEFFREKKRKIEFGVGAN